MKSGSGTVQRAQQTDAALRSLTKILGLKLDQILFVASHAFDVIGAAPNYADYIVFGGFQWARVVSCWPMAGCWRRMGSIAMRTENTWASQPLKKRLMKKVAFHFYDIEQLTDSILKSDEECIAAAR